MNKLVAMLFAVSFMSVSAQESEVADVTIENESVRDVSSQDNNGDVSQESDAVDASNNGPEAQDSDVACKGDFCGALSQNEDGSDVVETDVDVEPKEVELA